MTFPQTESVKDDCAYSNQQNNSCCCRTSYPSYQFVHKSNFLASSSVSSKETSTSGIKSAFQDVIAGALSGAIARTATAPIERVKLILQLQGSSSSPPPPPSSTTTITKASSSAKSLSAWSVCRTIYETEGFLAFWKGNFQNVLRAAGQAALNFALMDYYKSIALSVVPADNGDSSMISRSPKWLASFVAGGLAGGTVTTTVLYPTECLRTRLALEINRIGSISITRQILRTDGLTGLYKGYGISLFGSILYRLLYLGGYDVIKNEWTLLKHQDQSNTLTWSERFLLAQLVSISAGTMCYPFNTVRRRMMMQAGKATNERMYSNSMDCARPSLEKGRTPRFLFWIRSKLDS
jgi:solute carrier family 25 (adenine nucleotide translocator) protein 4/5/6/31